MLRGDLVTVEGFVCDGSVEVLGIVDSTLHANGSFARFDYPSALPERVQDRMAAIARRVIAALGLERTIWNIEMMYDAAADRVSIVEVNPRICGQFADLYQKVDGTNSYEIALALCTGARPRVRARPRALRRSGELSAARVRAVHASRRRRTRATSRRPRRCSPRRWSGASAARATSSPTSPARTARASAMR